MDGYQHSFSKLINVITYYTTKWWTEVPSCLDVCVCDTVFPKEGNRICSGAFTPSLNNR